MCYSVTAVASGAVLRALNKEQGPSRQARSSYGILRSELFNKEVHHKDLKPVWDDVDGMRYIKNTIDWILKKVRLGYILKLKVSLTMLVRDSMFRLRGYVNPSFVLTRSSFRTRAPLSARKCYMYLILLPNHIIHEAISKTIVRPPLCLCVSQLIGVLASKRM